MWLIRGLRTSIGQKFLMGVTGLLLCGFLVAHLAGNLLLYAGPGAYEAYAAALHKQEWLVKIAEVGLVILFGLHILLAFVTWSGNQRSHDYRPVPRKSKQDGRVILFAPSYWMMLTGIVIFLFLVIHLADFTWDIRHEFDDDTGAFRKAVQIMNDPVSFWSYVVGSVFLGIHLAHGFGSAFRSLGLSHPKYSPFIWWFGVFFAVVIGAGFLSFPLWAALYVSPGG